MKTEKSILLALVIVLLFPLLGGCDDTTLYTTNPSVQLSFQRDTVNFETVFTTIGSSTQVAKVYNRSNEHIHIRSVTLADASRSGFSVNIDGQSGTTFQDIEIRKQDSLYIFVQANINPLDKDNPILVKDSLVFELSSGSVQDMKLMAYGQDVLILRGKEIQEDTTFTSKRPILIYDSLRVNAGATLTLAAGTQLYFHDKIDCKVYGTLVATGTQEQPVTFLGDRMDNLFSYLPYGNVPGQWGGVQFFASSYQNNLNHVALRGGIYGIQCDSSDVSQPKLLLQNSVVHNMSTTVLSTTNSQVDVINSELTNAGSQVVSVIGGAVSFVHCTIANFFHWAAREGTAVKIANTHNAIDYPLLKADFTNSIITGSFSDELSGERSSEETVPFNYQFSSSLVNTKLNEQSSTYTEELTHYIDCVWDAKASGDLYGDKNFLTINPDNEFKYDFQLSEESLARNIASPIVAQPYPLDLLGRDRLLDGQPDAGCYEYTPIPTAE